MTAPAPSQGGALAGVRVLDLGKIYNGPYCSLLLAHLGADVVKIEPPGGETLRYRAEPGTETHEFLMLNSNKRSLVLDLKRPEGREVLRDLVHEADVLIENFARDAMERMGLGYDTLATINPRLVYGSGKGYGRYGPYADMAAMDITVQAMSGVIASTGFPDGPPVKAGPAFMDFLGGIHLFSGVLAALLQRATTGRGQLVDVSMHDSVFPTLASAIGGIFNRVREDIPERTGNRHSGLAVAPYGVYPTSDGHIALFCVTEGHWKALLTAMEREDLLEDARFGSTHLRAGHLEEVDAQVSAWTVLHEKWDLVRTLEGCGVPCAPVQTVHEVVDDTHLKERGMIRYVDHPRLGRVPVVGNPLQLTDSPLTEVRPAPTLGKDSDEVLRELAGYDADRICALRSARVIA
jgi:crotonobetainyl-CoA:carnitine CoA-transferase CaiB-like acyl-CoA transferase